MLALALLIAASTGWEAKVHFTHDPPRKSGGSEGAIHLSGSSVRIEEPTALGPAVILSVAGKVRLLFPESRQYLEIDPAQAALATVPPLSLRGMKPVGEERLAGRPCTIWERTLQTKMGPIRQRLWVPADSKRFLFLRYVVQTDRGATKADLTDIREAPQPASLFRVPSGFRPK